MSQEASCPRRLASPRSRPDDASLDIEAHERLHQALDYVSPAERHGGRHTAIIEARRRGIQEAKLQRRMEAYGGRSGDADG
jgi:hypothetical protein